MHRGLVEEAAVPVVGVAVDPAAVEAAQGAEQAVEAPVAVVEEEQAVLAAEPEAEVREAPAEARVAELEGEAQAVAREAAAPAAGPEAVECPTRISTTQLTASLGLSCRHFHLRLPRTSRFLRRWPKEPAASLFSTPTICSEGSRKSAASKTSFTSLDTRLRTRPRAVAIL